MDEPPIEDQLPETPATTDTPEMLETPETPETSESPPVEPPPENISEVVPDKIETPKTSKHSPRWPLIALAIVSLGMLAFFVGRPKRATPAVEPPPAPPVVNEPITPPEPVVSAPSQTTISTPAATGAEAAPVSPATPSKPPKKAANPRPPKKEVNTLVAPQSDSVDVRAAPKGNPFTNGELPEWRGSYSGIKQFRTVAVKSASAWAKLWKEQTGTDTPAPPVDFNNFMIVGVYVGQKTAPGAAVEILKTEETYPPALIVHYHETQSASTDKKSGTTQPFHLWVIPETTLPVKFKRQ